MTKSKFRGAHDYICRHSDHPTRLVDGSYNLGQFHNDDPDGPTLAEMDAIVNRDYRHKYPHISRVWDMPDDEREPYLKMLVTSANLVRLTIIAAGLSVGFAIIAVAAALWRGMS